MQLLIIYKCWNKKCLLLINNKIKVFHNLRVGNNIKSLAHKFRN